MRGKAARDLGHALWQALTGRAYSTAEKATTQRKTQEMVDRWGKQGTAQKLGVSVRTVERYMSGQIKGPGKRNRDRFEAAHREANVKPGRAGKLRDAGTASGPGREQAGSGGLAICGMVRVSQDRRKRWINPGNRMTDAEADHIINTMIQHGPDAAAADLNVIIQRYVPDMHIESIEEIDW
ncbi:hypothetical protein ABZ801_41415 [Actinomadura sp. NPDC047616]|uniref:hypothetical protein n=1 Tax=Actinomadura sp. NPDC047616 TaxID=3155914 RepID=UPI0033E25D24